MVAEKRAGKGTSKVAQNTTTKTKTKRKAKLRTTGQFIATSRKRTPHLEYKQLTKPTSRTHIAHNCFTNANNARAKAMYTPKQVQAQFLLGKQNYSKPNCKINQLGTQRNRCSAKLFKSSSSRSKIR